MTTVKEHAAAMSKDVLELTNAELEEYKQVASAAGYVFVWRRMYHLATGRPAGLHTRQWATNGAGMTFPSEAELNAKGLSWRPTP